MGRTPKIVLGVSAAVLIIHSLAFAQKTRNTPTQADWTAMAKLPDFLGVWELGGGGGGAARGAAPAAGGRGGAGAARGGRGPRRPRGRGGAWRGDPGIGCQAAGGSSGATLESGRG